MAGSTTAQGYGWRHQQERARWVRYQEQGGDDGCGSLDCRADRCLMPTRRIENGEAWDLGHWPGQRGWRGPEHVRCNRRAGGKNSRSGSGAPRPPRRRRVGLAEVSVNVSDL